MVLFNSLLTPSCDAKRILPIGSFRSIITDILLPGFKSQLNNTNLVKSYLKHPLMTFKIILAIHFEAFKLWSKGIKFISKKIKIKNNITLEN